MDEDEPIHNLPHGDRMFLFHSTQHLATKGQDPHDYDESDAWDKYDEEDSDLEDLEYRANASRCCRSCWVIDELLHHKKKGDDVAFHADGTSLPLPEWALDMLLSGHLHTALTLAIYFSPQQGGKENRKIPPVGTVLPVKASLGMEEEEEVTYLGYVGVGMAAAATWVGCDHSGETIVYCNLNALTPAGIVPLYTTGWEATDPARWYGLQFSILSFTNEHLMKLWYEHGFRETLFGDSGLVWRYPGARFVFSGYSHGSPMAQGTLLLFALEREQRRANGQLRGVPPPAGCVIDWNGYRWVQEEGRSLMSKYLGDQQVHFVSVRRWGGYIHYDPTAGYPDSGSNSPNMFSIDIDSSRIEAIENAPGTSRTQGATLSLDWAAMHAIHIKAVRRLTAVYGHT